MKYNQIKYIAGSVCLTVTFCALAQGASVSLGSAANFAVLAQQSVTSTSAIVNGDLGLSPGTSVTGNPVVTGSIHTGTSAVSASAMADAQSAYNDISTLTGGIAMTGALGVGPNQSLSPGVYDFSSSAELIGALTLSGSGQYVFRIGSTLTTDTGSTIVLTNGALAENVFFQVGSSATLGSGTIFNGNILSQASSTLNTSVANGSVIGLNGSVTLNGSTVTVAVPEPSALLLTFVGAGVIATRRRR